MWLRWWLRYLHAARRLRVARYSGSALAVVWAEREVKRVVYNRPHH